MKQAGGYNKFAQTSTCCAHLENLSNFVVWQLWKVSKIAKAIQEVNGTIPVGTVSEVCRIGTNSRV